VKYCWLEILAAVFVSILIIALWHLFAAIA
jgi:hypothetical protein